VLALAEMAGLPVLAGFGSGANFLGISPTVAAFLLWLGPPAAVFIWTTLLRD
jgi:hypothetical protein